MEDQKQLSISQDVGTESNIEFDYSEVSSDFVEDMLANQREIFTLIPIDRHQNDQKLLKGHLVNYNRKEKSLEELSKRFLDLFVFEDKANVQLDKISLQLGVERRRIYDIINILESLQVIVRTGKNNYQWNGINSIVKTIEKYKAQAGILEEKQLKKSKSLEVLSTGFLHLFLHWRSKMTLDEAAKMLVGNIQADKLKTKIRRLYDIANVFKSLGLLQKITLQTKKPGFQWIGVEGLSKLTFPNYLKTPSASTISSQSQPKIQNIPSVSSFFQQYLLESSYKMISSNKKQSLFNLVQFQSPLLTPLKNIQPNNLDIGFSRTKQISGCKSAKTSNEEKYGFRKLVTSLF